MENLNVVELKQEELQEIDGEKMSFWQAVGIIGSLLILGIIAHENLS